MHNRTGIAHGNGPRVGRQPGGHNHVDNGNRPRKPGTADDPRDIGSPRQHGSGHDNGVHNGADDKQARDKGNKKVRKSEEADPAQKDDKQGNGNGNGTDGSQVGGSGPAPHRPNFNDDEDDDWLRNKKHGRAAGGVQSQGGGGRDIGGPRTPSSGGGSSSGGSSAPVGSGGGGSVGNTSSSAGPGAPPVSGGPPPSLGASAPGQEGTPLGGNDALAKAIDNIRNSEFGKTEKGREIVAKLDEMYKSGRITMQDLPGNESGLGGNGTIKLDPNTISEKDNKGQNLYLEAVLVHEASHELQAKHGLGVNHDAGSPYDPYGMEHLYLNEQNRLGRTTSSHPAG